MHARKLISLFAAVALAASASLAIAADVSDLPDGTDLKGSADHALIRDRPRAPACMSAPRSALAPTAARNRYIPQIPSGLAKVMREATGSCAISNATLVTSSIEGSRHPAAAA